MEDPTVIIKMLGLLIPLGGTIGLLSFGFPLPSGMWLMSLFFYTVTPPTPGADHSIVIGEFEIALVRFT